MPRHADLSQLIVTVMMSRLWEEWRNTPTCMPPRIGLRAWSACWWLMQISWCHAPGASLNSPVRSSLRASTYHCASFFVCHTRTPPTLHPIHPAACHCLERMCRWMKEPPSVLQTCARGVYVYVIGHAWADSAPQQPWLSVFSLCQPTDYCCSHRRQCRMSNGDTTLTGLRFRVRFFPPCLISLHFNTHYFMSNAGEKIGDFPQFHRPGSKR